MGGHQDAEQRLPLLMPLYFPWFPLIWFTENVNFLTKRKDWGYMRLALDFYL